MTKKSRQNFKHLDKEKSFLDEIKSIFHHFWRDFIETNKKKILEGESPTLRTAILKNICERPLLKNAVWRSLKNVNV